MGRSKIIKPISRRRESALQRQTSRHRNLVIGRVLKINLSYRARHLLVQQRSRRQRIPTLFQPDFCHLVDASGHIAGARGSTLVTRTRKHTTIRPTPYTILNKADRAQCTRAKGRRVVNDVCEHLPAGPLAVANFQFNVPRPLDITTMLASSSRHPTLSEVKRPPALAATMPALFPARTPPKYTRSSQKPGRQAPKHMIPLSSASSSRSGTPFSPSESLAPSPPASPAPSTSSLLTELRGRSLSPPTSRSSSPFSSPSASRACSPSSLSSSTSRSGSPFSLLSLCTTSPAASPPISPAPSVCSEEFDGEWPEAADPAYPYHDDAAVFHATLSWLCDYPSIIQQALDDVFTDTFLGRPVRYEYESGPRDIEFEEMVLDAIRREPRYVQRGTETRCC
ncbi:hypothetical protein DENSPDRAFT_661648 [Dentipellis sp. KUC8613]|nr:hypothetical protein DENSPDRAFT_661648 [Dentipellis sp. KUC8613]